MVHRRPHASRVGAAITFPEPVDLHLRLQRVADPAAGPGRRCARPARSRVRADPAATPPEDVGGDVKLATFNVLNFFPTTGEEFVASGLGTCTYFTDRDGNPITQQLAATPTVRVVRPTTANLVRQRDKIVAAINTVDADIVSLEELENSVKFGKPRDFAINAARRRRSTPTPAPAPGPRALAGAATCRRWPSRTSSATASSTSRPTSRSSASPSC